LHFISTIVPAIGEATPPSAEPAFAAAADLYVAVKAPAGDYLLRPDGTLQPVSEGIVKWKSGLLGPVDEDILGDIPMTTLPAGTYTCSLMAAPAGRTDLYHLWETGLVVPATDSGIPLPSGKIEYDFEAGAFPLHSSDPQAAGPVGLGSFGVNGQALGLSPVASAGDTISPSVGLNAFEGPVDLYFAVYAPAIDASDYYILRPDNTLQKLGEGIIAWKEGVTEAVAERGLWEMPVSSLPAGLYEFYLFAAPAGDRENYYMWRSSLLIP